MNTIEKEKEVVELTELYNSNKSELVAIYGDIGVGKTYLVDNIFNGKYVFKHSSLSPIELETITENKSATELQLEHFYHSLKLYGMRENKIPKDWLEAFFMLKMLLKDKENGERQVIFFDELPWLDTKNSGIVTGLESFWNGFADSRNNLVIVCGSNISWMKERLINNHGGLYGRVTHIISLESFE